MQGFEVGFDVAVLPGRSLLDVVVLYPVFIHPGVESLACEAAVVIRLYRGGVAVGNDEMF